MRSIVLLVVFLTVSAYALPPPQKRTPAPSCPESKWEVCAKLHRVCKTVDSRMCRATANCFLDLEVECPHFRGRPH